MSHLSLSQTQAAASLLALTGGNILSGDRLPDLDITRLEILKKILPAFGEAARPVDLFDTDRHMAFALKIRRPFGDWTVAGLFIPSVTDDHILRVRVRFDHPPQVAWKICFAEFFGNP